MEAIVPYINLKDNAKKQIKILYACETGSRTWGLPSPDSNHDERFTYLHEDISIWS